MGKSIVIDPEFRNLLPYPSAEDRERLKVRLELEGCRDPLVVWRSTGILLDGHTRKEICDQEDIGYKITYVDIPTRDMALQWVIDNQLARRNLTESQKTYYLGMDYLNAKKGEGRPKLGHSDQVSESEGSTTDKIAAKHKVSPRTVGRAAKFANAINNLPEVEKKAVLAAVKGPPKSKVTAAAEQGKPLLCKRCKRIGKAVPNCGNCAEVQKKLKNRKPRRPSVPTRSGKTRFSRKEFDKAFGVVMRSVDDYAADCGILNSPSAQELQDALGSFLSKFDAWTKAAGVA